MAHNFLKLNNDKTKLLLTGNRRRVSKIHNFQLIVGDNTFKTSAYARNLGVYFNSIIIQNIHKQNCCQYAVPNSNAAIHDHLPRELISRLCTLLVIRRLDYCNYVLSGVPKCSLRPLQLSLNLKAYLVFKARRSWHFSALLDQLSGCWLTITRGKYSTLVFKARNDLYFSYLADLLHDDVPARALIRSFDTHTLRVHSCKLKTVGDRSLCLLRPMNGNAWKSLRNCSCRGPSLRRCHSWHCCCSFASPSLGHSLWWPLVWSASAVSFFWYANGRLEARRAVSSLSRL